MMKKHLFKLIPVLLLSVVVSGAYGTAFSVGSDVPTIPAIQKPGKMLTVLGPGMGEWEVK